MTRDQNDQRGLIAAIVGDGRPLITFTGLALGLSGAFALFLSATKHFLPHDVAFLGMTPEALCSFNECRIVHFMIHDRVSFGGSLIAIATLYLWLAAFPLRERAAWAWWTLAVSGTLGFGSFLLYLGYGYLDTWHGVATLTLLPCFLWGMVKSFMTLERPKSIRKLLHPGDRPAWTSVYGVGRLALLGTSIGLVFGGLTIMALGITTVFVPQDLAYMGLDPQRLHEINPNLIPLIAHDRAGFGGGVCCCGVTMFFCVWRGRPSRSLWQALAISGFAGFATAVFVHPAIGYNDLVHVGPAVLGAVTFALGLTLTCGRMHASPEGERQVVPLSPA